MNAKILIVDDEENIRFTLKKFLITEGYEAETADNYSQAVAKLKETDFDLIFVDIILKGKTGIDILKEVHKRKLLFLVVVITGAPTIETASDALRLGAFDYLTKPVRQDNLLQVTRSALRYKRLIDEKERYRLNLEAIFKSLKDGIITVDKDLSVVEINDSAGKICGISGNEAIGKPLSEQIKGCRGKCIEALKETLKTKKSAEIHRIECHCLHRPSQVVTVTTYPLLKRNDLFSGGVLVVRDETRLDDLERNLKKRRKLHNIVGKCARMQDIYRLIDNLANVPTTVMITGESGTGKELIAEALHYKSSRSHKLLVKANCSELSENLLESELFGHVKGAFTGAVRDKIGLFRRAEGSTIFLDEIGEMPPRMQLRLLRVLQEKEFKPVGQSASHKVDVRVVGATNKDLRKQVKLGFFRQDLYYRLMVVEIGLPPLRNRLEDIPLLVEHFLKRFNRKFNKNILGISEGVNQILMEHSWPGNIRELENSLEHAFILCRQHTIMIEHLPPDLKLLDLAAQDGNYFKFILKALKKTQWNKTKAARILGISRQSLYRKMKEHNIKDSTS